MTGFNSADTTKAVDTGVDMSANSDGSSISVGPYMFALIGIFWGSANAADGSVHLEVSSTGGAGTWETYPNSNYIMTTASGVHYWEIQLRAIQYIRVSYLKGSNTTGTFTTTISVEVPA